MCKQSINIEVYIHIDIDGTILLVQTMYKYIIE